MYVNKLIKANISQNMHIIEFIYIQDTNAKYHKKTNIKSYY